MAARVNQPEMAETLEEVNAQLLTIPELEGWFEFAHTLNGSLTLAVYTHPFDEQQANSAASRLDFLPVRLPYLNV